MKNKPFYLLSIISASLLTQSGANASPLVSIGDNADIFFNGSSSLRWQSNVFRDEDTETDDILWTFSPGFELNVGRGLANADFSVSTRYDILRYQDADKLDTELFHINAKGSYRASRLDLNASVSFDESQSTSGDNLVDADLIEYDTFGVRVDGEYRFSPKFSFGAGVLYSEREYDSEFQDRFADRESVSVPLDVFYEMTPKVDLSFGYVYSTTDIEGTFNSDSLIAIGDYETDSHFFNIGARGNLMPKLTGFFKIGYRTLDSDSASVTFDPDGVVSGPTSLGTTNGDDSGMLGLDGNLAWAASPKLVVRLALSREFGVGGEGQTTEMSSVDLSSSYSINSHFAATANLGYALRDYIDDSREDKQYKLGLRLTYSPNQHWNFGTGYTFSENDSNRADTSYTNHTLDLTASLRY